MLVSMHPEDTMSASDPQPSDLRRVSHGEAVDDTLGYGVRIAWKRVVYREGERVLHVDADHGADPPSLVVYAAGPWRWRGGAGDELTPDHKRLVVGRIAAALECLDVSYDFEPPIGG